MTKVKLNTAILMMQKNESELLDKWIIYHSEIFGLSNLHVFDNGSDDEQTKKLLLDWQNKGLSVEWAYSFKQDFESKGKILGDKIQSLECLNIFDCYIPLDCDEFLAVQLDSGRISCEAEDIFTELASNSECQDVLLIDAQFFNSPISDSWFHRFENRKCFFMKNTFESMDVGFHWGKVKNSSFEKKTNIVQFHFHNKPFVDAREHARNKLALRVDSFDKEYLANYKGNGRHLTKYFLLSEAEYLEAVLKASYGNVKSLAAKFEELNIEWPYKIKMEGSLSIFSPGTKPEQLDEVKSLHKVVEYRFRGSVDQILCESEFIRFDGWSSQMNRLPITNFVLVGENGELDVEIDSSVFRADIANLFGFKDTKFGYIIKVPLGVIRQLGVSEIKLCPKLPTGEVGPQLSVNPKFKTFINDM
ncbi:glycosyltransferase family 2 protein [Paraglaciecola sp. MB-3u-78]|jgi:hypothetical protein|uniref:glycosyltransferase family 2 protein n=1 Tax=Paraglaciecola sp. MB-3u-78 TaxID=2058332 RepID=UPI000C32AB6A|nr:glycosyltransferase family 2 protein [Paraglaciecola sp. MB-3u-78]PKH00955.1 hypothetical protein CXF95_01765 [Paraglaciecola sp. MB-3u-78]